MLSKGYSSFALGIVFVALVAVIWAASSVLVQYIYDAKAFESPFLLTYIGVSTFTWPLPMKYITEKLIEPCFEASADNCQEIAEFTDMQTCAACCSQMESSTTTSCDPKNPTADPSQNAAAGEDIETSLVKDDEEITLTPAASFAENVANWTRMQHIQAAAQIAPVWFLANWTYNASLALTSITSSTVIMSTCSLFAFLFAVCARDEGFHWIKSVGVGVGIGGVALTAIHDSQNGTCYYHCRYTLVGDLLAFISALAFGLYAVQVRILCPRNEELYSMQRLLGYIGLINMVLLSPIAIWELTRNIGLTITVFQLIIMRGLFDYVLSEYLFFRAVVLTSATVATLGLGLTIPMAFAADFILKKPHIVSLWSMGGALAVLLGFLFVNTSVLSRNTPRRTESFDEKVLRLLKEEETKRQQQLLQCHPIPCGCLVDNWMWEEEEEAEPGEVSETDKAARQKGFPRRMCSVELL